MVKVVGKLPFVVEPRRKGELIQVGSEESGKIEIERKGYLTTGEKAFVQQTIGSDNGSHKIISLSRRVANVHKISLEEGYDMVINALANNSEIENKQHKKIINNIREDYDYELQEIVTSLNELQAKEALIIALCMLRYRIDLDITVADVLNLHPDIVSGLVDLYRYEENASTERISDESSETEKK